MGRRATSPRLVGRERELADLVSAIGSDEPDRPLILLTGEAGIGKTRLLGEAIDRLRSGDEPWADDAWQVAQGSCLRLADGELPFAPILEVLDSIRDQGLSERARTERARLAGTDSGPQGSADVRTVRFLGIHDTLLDAAGHARLLVVVDDLHWADQSTLDLLLFLARRLRGGRVVLLAAYRSDELHRRHPLRPVIAELSRGFVRERLDLEPLDSDAVAEQVRALALQIEPDQVRGIVARADGNPFHVEELVALGAGRTGLPDTLRDVLLARVAELDADTVRVLGAAAVLGREADEGLLAHVLGVDHVTASAAIRTALDHSILVAAPDGAGYRFRHALLEEAVRDDLLPAERVDLHRRIAETLRANGGSGRGEPAAPGELARHLDLGGQPGPAVRAYLEAADVAFRALAWSEGVAAYERAAELAATVLDDLDPATVVALRDQVVPTALAMTWSGAPLRAVALLRSEIARAAANADPLTGAWLWMTLGRILNDAGDEAGSREASLTAAGLQPPSEDSELGVDLLIDLAGGAWMVGLHREALGHAERAVRGAERFGDPVLLFRALAHRAEAHIAAGHIDRGREDVQRARQLQAEHGWLDTYGYLPTNSGVAFSDAGYLEDARELWEEGLRMSRELGLTRAWDQWNLPGLAMYAYQAGRWAEADPRIRESRAFEAPGLPTFFVELIAGLLAAGRGDLDACDRALQRSSEAAAAMAGENEGYLGLLRAARADAAGDPVARLAASEAALRELDGFDSFVLRSRHAVEVAESAADLVARLHARRDADAIESARARAHEAAAFAADVDEGRIVEGTESVPWTRANAALACAEARRADGTDVPDDWLPVADAFRSMGMLPKVAYLAYRTAGAALRAGDRSEAATHLREAHALATTIGMEVLRGRIEALARAARIELVAQEAAAAPDPTPAPAPTAADTWRLSAREREVLGLLAQGRTNAEIGTALFISTKTASVHVTHILDKLGVSSRTEAALLASRVGLLEGELQPTE